MKTLTLTVIVLILAFSAAMFAQKKQPVIGVSGGNDTNVDIAIQYDPGPNSFGGMPGLTVDQAGTFTLSPEASKAYKLIADAENELQKQYGQLESNRMALLIGANVAAEARGNCNMDKPDAVVCSKPAASPSPAKGK